MKKRSAAHSMRAFNSPSKRTQQLSQTLDEENKEMERIAKLVTGEDKDFLRELRELDIFARADEDPVCSMSIDCSESDNRNIYDGTEYRTYTGMCNNLENFSWGMAGIQHLRLLDNAYDNGRWNARADSVTGTNRNPVALPTSRSVSNAVHTTSETKADNDVGVSLALFYFMQFIDHDIVKTPEGTVRDTIDCCGSDTRAFCMPIVIEESDNDDHFETGYCMDARRSFTVLDCDDDSGFQNQINDITAYIDASMIYGSSEDEADTLRSNVGGYLKTSTADFMPEAADPDDLPCDVDDPSFCFEAGDTRANVHPGLTTYHTIFVREHNRIAKYLGAINDDWSDERIFQETRKIVAAEIQHVTFSEMLPAVLDTDTVSAYGLYDTYSYNSTQDASIIQAFSLAYRYHNMMPATLHMTEADGSSYINTGSHNQEDAFESPSFLFEHNYKGVDQISLGFAFNSCPYANRLMNDAARNLLFLDDNGDSFDLATLNIERGREWGTPAYTEYRSLCGVGDVTDWDDLQSTHTDDVIAALQSVYDDPRDIDLWTGVVTETTVGTSISGPTQSCLVAKQFANLKYGDRFWYESTVFSADQLTEIKKVTLSRILCDNLDISKMPEEIFKTSSTWVDCSSFDAMDLSQWGTSKK
ncbi:peroxidasin homolog pxn-2-like [Mercenaria mercenaria]|uniref:peroxidasin homolog pxn-2-like n=1 Tax=Mercenaria mercenaria TaxID=6596 RepID=UPI00234E8843|nr:peroxidasin homolog pxn-2-like [Mercenaria mercenaria]